MVSDQPKVIEMAIWDLDDYLALFPDGLRPTVGHRMQAREMRDSRSGRLSAEAEASPTPTIVWVGLGGRAIGYLVGLIAQSGIYNPGT